MDYNFDFTLPSVACVSPNIGIESSRRTNRPKTQARAKSQAGGHTRRKMMS